MDRERRRILFLIIPALFLGAGLAWFMIRPAPDDEELVRAAILAVAEGARAADLAATIEPISKDYRDSTLGARDQVKGFLFMEFRRRGPITVVLTPITVDIDGETATAELGAALAEGVELSRFDLVPDGADGFRFTVFLRKEGGDWRITGHERERVRTAGDLLGL